MSANNRITAALLASALGAAFSLASGCGGEDNPSRYTRTIELPKRELSRINAKDFVKAKTPAAPRKR